MTKRRWLYLLMPLLIVLVCMTTWIFLRPRLTLWRIEGQARKWLGGNIRHKGFLTEEGHYLLLSPSVTGSRSIQASALRISPSKNEMLLIHPVLTPDIFATPIGAIQTPFHWSIIDGRLDWDNPTSAIGPRQTRVGSFLINGSGNRRRSELALISKTDGALQMAWDKDHLFLNLERFDLALLNDWFPSALGFLPVTGKVDGQLQIGRTSNGWRIESGVITFYETALQIAQSGWLWQAPVSKITIGGEKIVIKTETSGQLIDPSGKIVWACSDCQLYLEESEEGRLTLSGQGEEISGEQPRTFHIAAHGRRTTFLGAWENISLRIHDQEKTFGEIGLHHIETSKTHETGHWKLVATRLQMPELNILKETFIPAHPWLADWTPIQGTADIEIDFDDPIPHLHARDLRLRHRWGRVEAGVKDLILDDSFHLVDGYITVDGTPWSQSIEGEWATYGPGNIRGTGWTLKKKTAEATARLHWTGPVKQLFAGWKLESEQTANLDAGLSMNGSNLAITGKMHVEDQTGKSQETAQWDVVLSLGDPIPMIRGFARVDQLPLKHYLKPLFAASGRAQLQAQFVGASASIDFSLDRLAISHPRFQFEADSLHESNEIGHIDTLPAHLLMDWAEPSIRATIPIYGGRLVDLVTGLEVTSLSTTLELDGKNFSGKHLEGYVEGLSFTGEATGTLGAANHINVALESLHGTMHQVRSILTKVNNDKNILSKLPLDGKISLRNEGSWIRVGLNQNELHSSAMLCGALFDGRMNVRMGEMTVQDMSARFTYQYPTQTLFVDRILGTVLVGSSENIEEYQLTGDHLRCMDSEASELEFDLWVGDKARDIVRVVASTESLPTGIVFHFDRKKTHLGQIHPSILELSLKDLTQVDTFQLAFACPLGRVWGDLKRVAHTELFCLPRRLRREMDSLSSVEGHLVGNVNYNRSEGLFAYSLEADQLKVNQHQLGKAALIGSVQGDFWSVQQATLGDLTLSADILQEPTRWRVNFLGARLGGVLLAGLQGDYSLDSGKFLGQVNLFELSLSKLRDWKATRALARKASIKGNLKGIGTISVTAPLSEGSPWHAEVALDASVRGLSVDDIAFRDIQSLKVLLSEEGISFKNAYTSVASANLHLQWSEIKVNPWRHEYAMDSLLFRMPSASIPWMFKILHKWAPRDWTAIQAFLSGWGPNLEGTIKVTSASTLTSASIHIKDGNYRLGGRSYLLRDTLIDFNPYEFGITSRIDWGTRSLWVRLNSETPRLHQGRLMLSGEPPSNWTHKQSRPLTLNWRRLPEGTLSVSDLKGSLWGVSVDLRPKEGRIADGGLQFHGHVRASVDDLQGLLPDDLAKELQLWQVKSALEINGDWKISPSSAEGFAVDGTLLVRNSQVMGYQWELAEGSIKASPSNISLKQIRLTDQAGNGTIPELSGTRLQDGRWLVSIPRLDLASLSLNKIRRAGHNRHKGKKTLSLSQVHLNGMEGTLGDRFGWHGEGTIDFAYHAAEPATAFGKIPLGADIAYPAMGKIDFHVHTGRIHLIRLKDVYNEGKMVKFHLSDRGTPSSIGLDGTLQVALKIKPHHMLLKMIDKMTLEVTGTLKNPVCSVH